MPLFAILSDENPKTVGFERQLADVQSGGVVINTQNGELVRWGQDSIA